jgi:hypothetical protein
MKKWTFDLNEEDYVEFNIYHAEHSPKFKKNLFIQRFLVSAIFLLIPVIMRFFFGRPFSTTLPMFGIIWLIWVVFFTKGFKKTLRSRIIKNIQEAEAKGQTITGTYTLQETKDGVILKNKSGEVKIKWEAIGIVGEDEERLYLYISDEMAYIVPKRAFADQAELEEFRSKVDSNMLKRDFDKSN